MSRLGGVVLTVTGILACPCHLIITLPLLAGLLAGTALGSFLAHNTGLVYSVASIYFVLALALGYWFLFGKSRPSGKREEACPTCVPLEPGARAPERSTTSDEVSATRSME